MPANFLGKLLGRRAQAKPALAEAIADLERLARERPSLASAAALLRDVLPLVCGISVREQPPAIPAERAAGKLAKGVPLLRGEPVDLDDRAFRRRWQDVCAAIERHRQDKTARTLAEALDRGRLDARHLFQETLAGHARAIHARAGELGLDVGLAALALRLTLLPILTHFSETLAPLGSGLAWQPGFCPTCGSWPLLAEVRGLDQLRFLRCGLCAAEWEYPRLQCPFCGTQDHRLLGYFHAEGEESRWRAATCDACRGYVKTISTLGALSVSALLIADLATMHLDLAAGERGYAVPL